MARIRTIKPEFFTSADIVALTPMARLLYVALWCEADREGRMVWKPATFKLRYLPGDSCAVLEVCAELTNAGLVVLYGEGFAYIPSFTAHQHVNPRESISQLPDPHASGTRPPRVGTRQARDSDVQGGREGKGRRVTRDAFDDFWDAYPSKVGKDDARKAFAKHKPDAALLQTMLSALAVQRATPRWTKDGGAFIPNPATWLNQGRWQDSGVVLVDDRFAGAI